MDIERIIKFLEENKKELKDTNLGFYNYFVSFEGVKYVLSREISQLSEVRIVLPILKEKDWDVFLQKVKEEITPIPIYKNLVEKNVNDKYLKKLLGMCRDQAAKKIKDDGFVCRIVQEDEESYIITDDLRQDRVNLTISNNKVIEAHRG